MTRAILAALALLVAVPVALGLGASPAAAATRNFSVTSFTRIRVEGPYKVTLATGVAPFATATGSPAALDAISLDLAGNTLIVRVSRATNASFFGDSPGPATIALGTHELAGAWLNGTGSLVIDRVKGLSFDLSVNGLGRGEVGDLAVDQLKLNLFGAASARVSGSALMLDAVVRGASVLDAAALTSRDAKIAAEGPANVRTTVTNSAKVSALGVATVSLTGDPSCTVRATGSSSVDGCKTVN